MVSPNFKTNHGEIKMTELTQPIENDSFLNLLDELRDELEMISTTNALTTNVDGDDDIENAVMKSLEIVDTIAADLVAKQKYQESGYTNILEALPVNTLNNDVLYIGINANGTACIFNYIQKLPHTKPEHIECWYKNYGDDTKLMTGLRWWKILERPTTTDFFEEGGQAFSQHKHLKDNPYQLGTAEAESWALGFSIAYGDALF